MRRKFYIIVCGAGLGALALVLTEIWILANY